MKKPTEAIIKLRQEVATSDLGITTLCALAAFGGAALIYLKGGLQLAVPVYLIAGIVASLMLRFAYMQVFLRQLIGRHYAGAWADYQADEADANAWFRYFKKRIKLMRNLSCDWLTVIQLSHRSRDLWADEVQTQHGTARVTVVDRTFLPGASFNDKPIIDTATIAIKKDRTLKFHYIGAAGTIKDQQIPYDCFLYQGLLYQLDETEGSV